MASANKHCDVLHCESGSSSGVEFFDFPPVKDPRYAIWIQRTLQDSQWTPSSTSSICSKHFRSVDILATEAAEDSRRPEKHLKDDALPCVFECLPESERPQTACVPRPHSPEISYREPMQSRPRAVAVATAVHQQASIEAVRAVDAASVPTSSVDEDPSICCVPGCPSRRHQAVPSIRFHAFPTDKHLHGEWTKRVRCSVSWQPAPFSVVCSAHFLSTDYELKSGLLCLKSTAIPRQLKCMGQFMLRTDSPGAFDRVCAICGCWRKRIQKHYKAAARLAFVPFPTDPDEREKWNALRRVVSSDADLFACENHFLLTEIVSRFQDNGEELFTVRSGVVPHVEPAFWLDAHPENPIPRASGVENFRGTERHTEVPVQVLGTVSATPAAANFVVLFRNAIPAHNVQLRNTPSKLPIPRNVESPVASTEVCCVPGCPVKASNAGEINISLFRFVSRLNSSYTTWINRIRCATTWIDRYPLAICNRHFLPEDFDPLTRTVSPNALPSQLSCISAFHFSGLREGETDVTELQTCVVCGAKRKPGSTKTSERLGFFGLPADPVGRTAWCNFISAQKDGQNPDPSSLVCENHFLPTNFIVRGGKLKQSAVPSCTFRLQPEFKPLSCIRIPVLTANTVNYISSPPLIDLTEIALRIGCRCCVSGCKNDFMSKREKLVTFFKFITADDPRYATWLERVRPDLDWSPDNSTVICSGHFLPSQITLRERGGVSKRILSKTALPSLLNGKITWQPSELRLKPIEQLKRLDSDCCVSGCENRRGSLRSNEVTFFMFLAADDPRYDTWLHRVRPSDAWIPDIHTRICSAHFFATQIWHKKNENGETSAVLSSFALPSLLNGETKWEPSEIKVRHPKQERRSKITKKSSCNCCVMGCENVRGQQNVYFFTFPASNGPRYKFWLERVRPSDSWTPDSQTRICGAHFLESQLELRKNGSHKRIVLNCRALPSLLKGECMWEPNELLDSEPKRQTHRCCVSVCGNMPGRISKKVLLFKFVKPEDPRYETWLQRVRPETDWVPNGFTRICSEHFLPSQIIHRKGEKRTVVLRRTALPSQLDGKTAWEPINFRSAAENEMEMNGMRRFFYNCCVPGCGNVRTEIGSKNVTFFKFVAPEEARYKTWLRRLQYNSVWIPQNFAKVCSEHFLESDSVRRKQCGTTRAYLKSTAVPSQLSCLTALCGFTESDMISEKIGCVVCGLVPFLAARELKPSERLQFFRCPVGELKKKWIAFIGTQATPVNSMRLTENALWYVCENHFAPGSFEPQTETVSERPCLLADAVPSVPFALETNYVHPVLRNIKKGSRSIQSDGTVSKEAGLKKRVDDASVFDSSPSKYTCVVPGCPHSSQNARRSCSERVTFHIFPTRSSARFDEWMKRIRCAVSWSPNLHDRICSLHFLPEDFIEETSKGKQCRTRQPKRTTVPSKLECVEKFRSPKGKDTELSADDRLIQTCCICGCWRPVSNGIRHPRSEKLTFFPFPADDDQRELWNEVCRKSHPEFVLSDESVVCENHFRPGDLICVLENKKATKVVLEKNAVPSERNFAWITSDYDDDVSQSYLFDAPDVDEEETMDDCLVDPTETDYDDVIDTQLDNVSSNDEDEDHTSLPFAAKWQIPPDNGLPEDDEGDTFNPIRLMADLPPPLPSSMDDECAKSLQPLSTSAGNGALMCKDCAMCQVILQTPCWLHSNSIADEPVIPLAVGSLPNVLYMDVCDDSPNGKAVFAKDAVPRHTVFGPLVAPLATEEDAAGAQYFIVSEMGMGSRRTHFHLESDYACNWMKYVRFAESMEASNLLVFARGLEIVFVTSRTISSHEELRVWYSAQYTEIVTDVKPFIPDLHPEREATGINAAAVDIVDDGSSLCDSDGDEGDKAHHISCVSSQDLPVTILPVSAVPPLSEGIHSDLDIAVSQTQNRKKRSRALRDDTSSYFNRNICPECSTRFRRSDMLELHKYSHSYPEGRTTERPERQCPECRKDFPAFDELLVHVNQHGTKLVPCPVCNDLCSTTTLYIHIRQYHPQSSVTRIRMSDSFDCHECGLRFTTTFLYRLHQYQHGTFKNTESMQFSERCPECKEVFQEMDTLVKHVDGHGKAITKCPVCLQWYGAMRKHLVNSHPEYPIPPVLRTKSSEAQRTERRTKTRFDGVTCYECCLRFSTDLLCQLHKYKHGTGESAKYPQPHQKCPECGEVFVDFDQLVKHVDDHARSIEKCPVCSHWLVSLHDHVRRNHPTYHSQQVSQRKGLSTTCPECGMRFPTGYLCQLHNIGHGKSEEIVSDLGMPTKCPQCSELLKDFDELVEHVNLHGKVSHKCPVCDLWVGFLSVHMRRKHPDQEYVPDSQPVQSGDDIPSRRNRIQRDSDAQQTARTSKTMFHRLTCYECRLRFPTEPLHQFHRSRHDTTDCPEWPEKCPECDVPFDDIERPLDHVDSHAKRIRKCHICHQWHFALTAHMRRSHPEYHGPLKIKRNQHRKSTCHALPCPDCGLRFTTDFLCGIHQSRHGHDEYVLNMTFPRNCPECAKVFEKRSTLVEHVDTHGKVSKKCPVCGEWLAELTRHLRRNHPEHELEPACFQQPQRNLTCASCGARFPTEILCQLHNFQHINVEDREPVQFTNKCPQCDQVFQELDELAQHVDEHGTALKRCPVCEMWFSKLRVHIRHCHPDYSKSLTCSDCGLRFKTDPLYQLHKYRHGDTGDVEFPQICPECDETFEQLDTLMDHIEQHGRWMNKCPVCHEWYSAVKEHMRRSHPVSKPDRGTDRRRRLRKRSKLSQHFPRLAKRPKTQDSTCYYCDVCFPNEALCKLHIYKHGRTEYAESLQFPQECPECCETFEELPELVEHVETHGNRVTHVGVRSGALAVSETETCDEDSFSRGNGFQNAATVWDEYSQRGYECLECGKEFRLLIGLQAHAKTCRQSNMCAICNETFGSKSAFDQHVASHNTDKGFLCGICLEKFPFYRLLVAHAEKHGSEIATGNISEESDSAFKCVICQNGFASSDELNKHVKGHEGRDGFACIICSEKFPFYRLLSRHVADEHRPADSSSEYSCTVCNGAFAQLDDLEMHLFTHDAELQFKCDQPQCGKRFVSMKSLQGHISAVHKKQKRKAIRHKLFQTKRKRGW